MIKVNLQLHANSRIGAENLTLAKLLSDIAGGATTYDAPFAITKKLIKIGVKQNASMDPLYADDQTVDVYIEDGDITIEISLTDLTEDEKAIIFGQTMAAGVRSPNPAVDVRPYFAVSWKSKKRDGTYKYYKVVKVIFKEPDEDFETKKDKSAAQTDVISGTGIQRLSDGLRKRVADASSSSWVAATGTSWFAAGDITADAVAPTATVVPADAAINQLATVNVVWTFDKAILAAYVTAANFFVIKSDGTAVAGALSIGTNDTVVTFTPTAPLTAAAAYIAIATTGVKDKSGNALAANLVSNFTIAA